MTSTDVSVRGPRVRRRLVVRGVVQGVGFRPHVYAQALSHGLAGAVWNTADGVLIEVEGDLADVESFVAQLRTDPPPLAVVESVSVGELPPAGGRGFTIRASDHAPGRTLVSPDVSLCEDCLAELADPADRRHRHPFITCTHCGPRYTVTVDLPYDRPTTTMAGFAMCPRCAAEYADPADRRFHAQTICCPDCGPRLRLSSGGEVLARDDDAVRRARRLLADGAAVAVKGIGGFHLACDATSETATARLRARKRRGDKPFAVMVASPARARTLVGLDPAQEELLCDRSRPIVLAPRLPQAGLAASVAPGNGDLGIMLAYSPLHHLLLGLPGDEPGPDVLVMTSGNLAGEPLVTDDAEALDRLAGIADAWLLHDRAIHVPCDDTVTRVVAGAEAPVRRSRGQAPLPLALPFDSPPALGTGADLKNTFCLAEGRRAWLSPHIGDMDDLATLAVFDRAEAHMERLTGVRPTALATDRHPGYRSRRWALEHAAGRPVAGVQHHHAHVASTMADNGLPDGVAVIGIAFDGTGYGDDGAVWGGEVLLADYRGFERVAHLDYVPLPGGDAGVRNPYRMALSHLRSAGLDWDPRLPSVRACARNEPALLERQLATGLRCAPTSSMGRLYDAVASLTGICHRVGYDAQAAMELESAARPHDGAPGYAFGLEPLDAGDGDGAADGDRDGEAVRVQAAPVIAAVVDDVLAGTDPALVAARFQTGVVDLVVTLARRVRDRRGLDVVTLSGGVFLNAFLTAACAEQLSAHGFTVLRHRQVPASDAGIALGQVAVLAHSRRPPATDTPTGGAAGPGQRPERSRADVSSSARPGPGHQRA